MTTRKIVDKLGKTFLDVFYPKICFGCGKVGHYFCSECEEKLKYIEDFRCIRCQGPAISGFTHSRCLTKFWPERIVYAFSYKKPLSDALIAAKYDKKAYSIYGELVNLAIDYFNDLGLSLGESSIFVPIPLHEDKLDYRGFNQAEVISNCLSGYYKIPVMNDVLIRTKPTKRQSKIKNKKERKENVKDAFRINENRIPDIAGKDLVLVDDICTTGSTLTSAFKALKFQTPVPKRPRYIYCLALAKD